MNDISDKQRKNDVDYLGQGRGDPENGQQYIVFLFSSISHALKAEKILNGREITHKLIPMPRHISSDCGVCLRVQVGQYDMVTGILQGLVDWKDVAFL